MGTGGASPPDATRAFYDRISRAYDLIADGSEHEARESGLDLLAAAPGERVLEVGCGTGRAQLRLAGAVGERGRVVGLDLSAGMLHVARSTLSGSGGRLLVQGDARRLPFRAGAFAAVFSSFTVELFAPEVIPAVLTEMRRVLAPGGRLGVVSLLRSDPEPLASRVYDWLHRHFPHFVDCQPIELPSLLAAGGFEIREEQRLSIWGLPVLAVVAVSAEAG